MPEYRRALLFALTVLWAGAVPAAGQVAIRPAFPGVSFQQVTDVVSAPDASGRVFVVEQVGRIWIVEEDRSGYSASLFLDISGRISCCGERGLLGLAFHPDFGRNHEFFVDYVSSDLKTTVSRFLASQVHSEWADPDSEEKLIEVEQPYSNHNAGKIAFGPDGYLYVSFGDGGSQGDPGSNGQNLSTFLSAMLRIDVDSSDDGLAYGIPESNPYVGNLYGAREEIFAHGFRNPWRFSFGPDGTLWVADVGWRTWEELNWVESGRNYGWSLREGPLCHAESCSGGLVDPVFAYDHANGDRSVTGGFVYRGAACDRLLEGTYVFGDYISGRIWSAEYDDSGVTDVHLLVDTDHAISTFGEDPDGELLFAAYGDNTEIYALDCTALPVELVSFSATVQGSDVLVRWTTASEIASAGFGLESRSIAGLWTERTYVQARGSEGVETSYSELLTGFKSGLHWLRLRQMDADGTVAYSDVVEVRVATPGAVAIEVWPLPVVGEAAIHIVSSSDQQIVVDLYDVLGRRVQRLLEGDLADGEERLITLRASEIAPGLYMVVLAGEFGIHSTPVVVAG